MAGLLKWVGRSVDELVKLGYPESVAERITSGDLPMDEANRMARAAEQGYDPRTYYHGTPDSRGIKEKGFDRQSGFGMGEKKPIFMSKDKWLADTYADDARAFDYQNATPETLELRVKKGNEAVIDFGGESFRGGKVDLHEYLNEAEAAGVDTVSVSNIRDTYHPSSRKGNVTAVFDPENIRSVNAAFDPEYTGPNILGSRVAPTATTGLLGMNQLQSQNAQVELDNLMSQYDQMIGRKPDIYNYGDIAPVKRNVVSGEYSLAVPTLVDDIVKGLLDLGQSRKTGVVNSPTSIWEALL